MELVERKELLVKVTAIEIRINQLFNAYMRSTDLAERKELADTMDELLEEQRIIEVMLGYKHG